MNNETKIYSASRAFHKFARDFLKKFPVISQKVAQKLLKKSQTFAVNADIF